jgi:hypothetical protein
MPAVAALLQQCCNLRKIIVRINVPTHSPPFKSVTISQTLLMVTDLSPLAKLTKIQHHPHCQRLFKNQEESLMSAELEIMHCNFTAAEVEIKATLYC